MPFAIDVIVRDSVRGTRFDNGATADITRATIAGHAEHGVLAESSVGSVVSVVISDSVSTINQFGFGANGTATSKRARLTISGSTASHNQVGFVASGPGATMTVSGSMASRNVGGFVQDSGATFQSLGNNAVADNALGDASGVITAIVPK